MIHAGKRSSSRLVHGRGPTSELELLTRHPSSSGMEMRQRWARARATAGRRHQGGGPGPRIGAEVGIATDHRGRQTKSAQPATNSMACQSRGERRERCCRGALWWGRVERRCAHGHHGRGGGTTWLVGAAAEGEDTHCTRPCSTVAMEPVVACLCVSCKKN